MALIPFRIALAKELLAAMDWSCLVLKHGFEDESSCTGEHFNEIVKVQSILYTLILASKSQKFTKHANNR